MNFTPHQYITNWHDSFVDYIGSLLGVVAGLMARPEAKEAHLTSSFFHLTSEGWRLCRYR